MDSERKVWKLVSFDGYRENMLQYLGEQSVYNTDLIKDLAKDGWRDTANDSFERSSNASTVPETGQLTCA